MEGGRSRTRERVDSTKRQPDIVVSQAAGRSYTSLVDDMCRHADRVANTESVCSTGKCDWYAAMGRNVPKVKLFYRVGVICIANSG